MLMKQLSKIASAIVLLTTILVLSFATSTVNAFEVTATISLIHSGGYYGVAYDSLMGEVFIANGDTDSVTVISDSTNKVVATVPVGKVPYGTAYDSG